MDLRKWEKYIVIFRCSKFRSLLISIHYVEEIIFELILQENNITLSTVNT